MQVITSENQNINFLMKILDILLLSIFYFFSVLGLEIPPNIVIIAVIGSVSGALVLTYFQRENWLEMIFKVVSSSLSGLFVGAVIHEYFALEKITYIGFNYFITSLLSLIFLRAILSTTEKNAIDWIRQAIQRLFNLQTKDERKRK